MTLLFTPTLIKCDRFPNARNYLSEPFRQCEYNLRILFCPISCGEKKFYDRWSWNTGPVYTCEVNVFITIIIGVIINFIIIIANINSFFSIRYIIIKHINFITRPDALFKHNTQSERIRTLFCKNETNALLIENETSSPTFSLIYK